MKTIYPTYYYFKKDDLIIKKMGHDFSVYEYGEFIYDNSIQSYYFKDEYLENGELIEIDYIKAYLIINEKIINKLFAKREEDFKDKKKAWNENPGWPAKIVSTRFVLNNIVYTLYPCDVCDGVDYWDDGFMETIQKYIEKDLQEVGATNIYSTGFLD